MILYIYLFVSVALLPILNAAGFEIFGQSYSWWLAPLLLLGFFVGLILLHLIIGVISLSVISLKSDPNRGTKYYRWLINITLPMLLKIGRVHIHSKGLEKVPQSGRFLLVCNHNHDIDPAIIIHELPHSTLSFIGKKEIYTMPKFWIVARAMHKLNCLPIDRENNRNAVETIVKATRLIKNGTASVGVFPEGYTSLDGRLHEFRNGVFKIACKSECPVVVCTLVGTRAAAKKLIRRRSDIYLDVVETIPAQDIANMNTAEISARVHADMERALAEHGATQQEF